MKIFVTALESTCTINRIKIEDDIFGTYVHVIDPEFYQRKQLRPQILSLILSLLNKNGIETITNQQDGCRAGIIFAIGNTNFGYKNSLRSNNDFFKHQEFAVNALPGTNMVAGLLANKLKYFDHIHTDSTACCSSGVALHIGSRLIEIGDLDRVIVVSAEDPIRPDMLEFFVGTKACFALTDEERGKKISAFDKVNGGFCLGQSVSYTILENERSLDKTKRHPLYEVLATSAVAEECSSVVGMSESGSGYRRVISNLLTRSDMSANDIDVIKTHGSGTATNNQAEGAAIRDAFAGTSVKATSYKQIIGHTFGPSFLTELDLITKDIRNGYLTPIPNRTETDPLFLSEKTDVSTAQNILCMASGIANSFCGATLKRLF